MIRIENLNINLKNNKLLIGNINIFIHSGCIVSIIGKPASGKTKLFNIIGLLEKANAGNLYILGKNTNKLDRNEISSLHKEISLVSESNDLIYNLGVKENITLPLIAANKIPFIWSSMKSQSRILQPSPYKGIDSFFKALSIVKGINFSGNCQGP